jgi:hypothetical protein
MAMGEKNFEGCRQESPANVPLRTQMQRTPFIPTRKKSIRCQRTVRPALAAHRIVSGSIQLHDMMKPQARVSIYIRFIGILEPGLHESNQAVFTRLRRVLINKIGHAIVDTRWWYSVRAMLYSYAPRAEISKVGWREFHNFVAW